MEKVPTRKQWADLYEKQLKDLCNTFLETFKETIDCNQQTYNAFVEFAYNMSPGYVSEYHKEEVLSLFADDGDWDTGV